MPLIEAATCNSLSPLICPLSKYANLRLPFTWHRKVWGSNDTASKVSFTVL